MPARSMRKCGSAQSWLVIDIPPGLAVTWWGRQPRGTSLWMGLVGCERPTRANWSKPWPLKHAVNFARTTPGWGAHYSACQCRATPVLVNQSYRSVFAFGPSNLMLALTLIPAMLTAHLGGARKGKWAPSSTHASPPGSIWRISGRPAAALLLEAPVC